MSLDLYRVLKIKSIENAEYKPSYNRIRFVVSPDNMATDLSESYLSFELYVVNGLTSLAYTPDEITNLIASNVMFSFGQHGEAYPSACLIRTARLYALGHMNTVLEEINYSNVLQTALFQLSQDFETLASNSLLTMSATGQFINGSMGASSSYFGSSISASNNASVQVNVKLSDIFGLCKSSNFWLSQTNGLEIMLEFEDSKPLIQQTLISNICPVLPSTFTIEVDDAPFTYGGFTPDYSTNQFSNHCLGQNTSASVNSNEEITSGSVIQCPKSSRFGPQ